MAISLPILDSSWEDGEIVEIERRAGGEDRETVLPAPPVSGFRKRGFWKTILLGGEGWPFAIAVAVAAHVGLAVIGLFFYAAKQVFEGPTLVLPYGWAAEFEGTGPSGTVTYSSSPSPLAALGEMDGSSGAATVSKELLVPPPGEVDVSDPQKEEIALDPAAGTSDDVPVIGVGIDNSAPAVNFRPSPFSEVTDGGGSGSGKVEGMVSGNENGGGTGEGSVDGTSNRKSGTGNAGEGSGDGGGRMGFSNGSLSAQAIPVYYPPDALRRRASGMVWLSFDVSDRGKVTNVRLVKSSGERELDEAALDGTRRWRNPPKELWATLNNTVPINFIPPPKQ